MTYKCFEIEVSNSVAHLKLSRPDAYNSMISEFWSELPKIVSEIDEQSEARVVVISSTGKHFSSGMDLAVFQNEDLASKSAHHDSGRKGAAIRQLVLRLQESFNILEKIRMPVLAAIQGGCVGGGVDLVSACDCRYATKDAFFVIQEINLGMTADVGTFPRLCHLMPTGMVRELAYTGRRLSAQRALDLGLVNQIFETHEDMLSHVMDIAEEIVSKSPLAVYGSKVMINYARDHSVANALDYIATWQSGMFNPEVDMMESFAAKSQKRKAKFQSLLPYKKGYGL